MIASKVDSRPIGRYPVEDLSLLPKRVLSLAMGTHASPFIVQKSDKGYTVRALGAPTGAIDGQLFAVLLDFPPAEDWIITPQPQHGENTYTIEKNDRSGGWVVDDEEVFGNARAIKVKPLIATKSLPPQYPNTELFTFVRVDRDD